jgi:hypothetical protein
MAVLSWAIVVLLAAFSATGVVIVVREVRRMRLRSPEPAPSLAARFDRYVGPIDASRAPLTPPLRVAAEFLSALCGFPGLGWMVSGRVRIGLPLIIAVPALIWALFPLFVSYTGVLFPQPLAVFSVLPAIAVASAAALAACEARAKAR